ncbi:MAG: hypothetical protein ACR2MD_16765, partial [Aridibacter sp.]
MFKYLKQLFINQPERNEVRSAKDLLKMATEKKESGNVDEAIELLRKAYTAIGNDHIVYSVSTFLRLPLYLQKAGRNDEAWREFNLLLTRGYPNQIQNVELLPMEHSQIYDKMRLFLQRENKYDLAIRFGISSFISWAVGLHRQKRKSELKEYIERENIEVTVIALLRKAKKLKLKDKLTEVVESETK